MQINTLDHGFVRLVDSMGSDSAIVQAARVSYGGGTKTMLEDRSLIRYLVRNKHTSPLEMVEFKFHLKMPIFIARQHIRHRTASINEVSARYSVMGEEFYIPDEIRGQSVTNKQCSAGVVDGSFITDLKDTCNNAYEVYQTSISNGVSRELARCLLPVNLYTEMYWKIDAHNLLHYIKLRLHSHAQKEIQVYAKAMLDLIKPTVPMLVEAFEDYILNASTFSARELEFIRSVPQSNWGRQVASEWFQGSELKEFLEKLKVE
jgi:thymidylate synthase (FAD)